MGYRVKNAIVMVAGLSSRFAPISYEKPKPLIPVRGEILVERQIRQLLERGISEIILVTGYQAEQFAWLGKKYGITLVENKEYLVRNNHSSIYAAREYLDNSYICSGDNYFVKNPFREQEEESCYAALFSPGETGEWCLQTDEEDWITGIEIGGSNQWYMMGHVFWSREFSQKFLEILKKVYDESATRNKLWEDIYREHMDELHMKMKRYGEGEIFEFDSLDELRDFDPVYWKRSGSVVMEHLADLLNCEEGDLTGLKPLKDGRGRVVGVAFSLRGINYRYEYQSGTVGGTDVLGALKREDGITLL